MKYLAIACCAALALVLFSSGCTSTGKIDPSAIPGLGAPSQTVSPLQPQPVDIMPSDQAVEVQVNPKDTSYATVTSIFAGGKGQNMVRDIQVKLTRSDGGVLTGSLKPEKLSEVTLQGTRETDRIEVRVSMLDGRTYKIVDQAVPFKNRG
jgi:hypothetical protein